jgi:hypothetical protein
MERTAVLRLGQPEVAQTQLKGHDGRDLRRSIELRRQNGGILQRRDTRFELTQRNLLTSQLDEGLKIASRLLREGHLGEQRAKDRNPAGPVIRTGHGRLPADRGEARFHAGLGANRLGRSRLPGRSAVRLLRERVGAP